MNASKQLGHIKELSLDIDSPIKMQMPKIEFQNIALFIGTNGTGKSLILKLVWCAGMIGEAFISSEVLTMPHNPIDNVQYIFDKSFSNQNFNGKMNFIFEDRNNIAIEIEKGKVIDVNISFAKDLIPSGPPVFMSTETRTFDDITRYLQVRKMVGVIGQIDASNASLFEKVLDMYKLYDAMFIERLISKLSKPYILKKDVKDTFKSYEIKEEIESIGFDENKSELYYINSKAEVKLLRNMSKGEQSLINMTLCNQM